MDLSLVTKGDRTDHQFKHHYKFFDSSKFNSLKELSHLIYHLPFQLNYQYNNLCLQVNEYICASYFRKDSSKVAETRDSSFETDTGKKLTAMLFVFPESVAVIE